VSPKRRDEPAAPLIQPAFDVSHLKQELTKMTRTTRNAALLVMIGLGALQAPSPAAAGGGVTMMFTPNGDSARMLNTGLQIYSMVQQKKNKKKNNVKVVQKGKNNASAVSQKGSNNAGLIYQKGNSHMATVSQDGWGNALGVFQFGKKTKVDVAQYGNGQTGIILQGGW
jgi:hypothetical protein